MKDSKYLIICSIT